MPDSSKSRLGKYELLEEIGDGAEGRIYKARCVEPGVPDVAVGEFVALKRLRQTGSETQSDIFKRTSRILRALNHPNIVRYKDSFVGSDDALDEEVYCLVTELLEGQTLKELLDNNKSGLPWDRAQRIITAVLEALAYAGTSGVVHRDLKPSNIYLTKDDEVKLIDFGIARHEDSGATTTSTGGLLGSFDFMAPDFVLVQEGNFRGDQQSDIFSFGVCFFQVMTGTLPYPPLGGNAQIAYFQRYVSPDKLPKIKYSHPIFSVLRGARACLEKCLTYNRENRYKTFAEVLSAMQGIQRRTLQHAEGDKYEYVEYIGKGGFGKVFRARRLSDGLEVAVKEVMADRNSSRFVREAKMLRITQHPHLVQYLDFIEMTERGVGDERRLFLVLEYLLGMPESGLNYRIKMTPGGLDPVEALRAFDAFLDCLEYLHQNTIIHRDIKPGNLYAPAGAPERAKIFDLGIAHDTDGTKTHGQVPGTLDYMPPEFATQGGERGAPQSDIYSIGVTLYQALAGKLPLERLPDDEKSAWTAWYLRCEKPPEIPFVHPVFTAHPELEKLVRKAIAFRAEDRFASAKEMRNEIRAILEKWDQAIKREAYEKTLALAQAALDKQNYDEAVKQARAALESWPEGVEAKQLLDRIETERLRRTRYDLAMTAAKKELERNNTDAAARHVRLALEVWPEGTEARQFLDGIETARQRRVQYETLVAAARRDLDHDNIEAASRQAQEALQVWPDGAEAKQVIERIAAERNRKQQYDDAIQAAKESLERSALDDASSNAQRALELRPLNTEAQELLDQIETERLRRIQYDTALIAAKSEFGKDDIDAATRHARIALELWPEGPEAKELLDQMVSERDKRTQYEGAMTAAKRELERGNITAAVAKAQAALEISPERAEASQFLERLETEQQRKSRFDAALVAAREALEREDFEEALRKAKFAVEVWPEKTEAKRLLDRIETERNRKVKYENAIAEARAALEKKEFGTAKRFAEEALSVRPRDPVAMDLRASAEKGIREQVDDEPATMATFVEPPPTEAKPANALVEPRAADEPKTMATVVDGPPVDEVKTLATVVEPPSEKPPTSLNVVPPPPEEPIVAPVPEPEPVKPPPPPPPPPPKPEPVTPMPAPEPSRLPVAQAPARPEQKKKSMMPVVLALAACVVIGIVVVVLKLKPGSKPPAAESPTATQPPTPTPTSPAPSPAALVVYGDGTVSRNISDNGPIYLACLAKNPAELKFSSSSQEFLADSSISFKPAQPANAATNGFIMLQPRRGFSGNADVTVDATGAGLSSVKKTIQLRISGQPTPPQIETTAPEYSMDSDTQAAIPVTARSDYFAPSELQLSVKSINQPDALKADAVQRTSTGFSVPVTARQPGTVELALALTAPNGTFTDKGVRILIKPRRVNAPPQITGLLSSMVIGSFGQLAQPIQLMASGGVPPLKLEYQFSPQLARRAEMLSGTEGSGTRFTITPPQGVQGKSTFTAIVTDGAGHRVTASSAIQFLATNSIGMPLVWIPGLPNCASQWLDLPSTGGWAGQFEVTQAEFTTVTGGNPSRFKAGGNYPVESMTVQQATAFCDELTRRDGAMLPQGWHYALPTQAQWESLAAGTAVDNKNACYVLSVPKPSQPEEVGRLLANPYGLYDVLGNVAELTSSHWESADPQEASFYICRGGGFRSSSSSLVVDHSKVAANKFWMFNEPRPDVGFRIVVVPR